MKNKPYPYYSVPQINNLKEMVSFCSNTYKNSTAFQFEAQKVSYQLFEDDIKALGTALYNMGLYNSKIGILGENSYAWILSYFAIVNGGNVVVPLDFGMTETQLAELIMQSGISAIIYSKKCRNKLDDILKITPIEHCLELDIISKYVEEGRTLLLQGMQSFLNHQVDNETCCSIIYTSGTTSQPKGVELSHKNLTSDTLASLKNVSFGGSSILVLPLFHTFAFTANILCLLLSGKTIVINRNLRKLKDDFMLFRPQNLVLVPMILESLYKQIWIQAKAEKKEQGLKILISVSNALLKLNINMRKILFAKVQKAFGGRLEFIITGGAPVNQKYVQGFRELGIQVLNGYGITECAPVLAVNRNSHYRDGSVGQVLDGIKVKIMDGEICVKGDMVMAGYHNNPRETADVLEDGWFKTGDLGYLDKDNFLYITGRKKNCIILSNGKNVSPEELEGYLYNLEYVVEALVYQIGDKIEASVYFGEADKEILRPQFTLDLEKINRSVPLYKNINSVKIRDREFEKTSTKKIRRNQNVTSANL